MFAPAHAPRRVTPALSAVAAVALAASALVALDRSTAHAASAATINGSNRPGTGRQARFSYSTNGVDFTSLGPGFTLNNAWQFFMGYRYGIFNYATTSLGGTVTVTRFDLTTP